MDMRRLRHLLSVFLIAAASLASASDLPQVQERGVLRHLGIPYAHFVTGSGDGLDVEIVQGFAASLGAATNMSRQTGPGYSAT